LKARHPSTNPSDPYRWLRDLRWAGAIYDSRFWIYDNTILSSILRGFTVYIFIKLEITN
jgi:hypothetical protein